jgi:hypothetical protein
MNPKSWIRSHFQRYFELQPWAFCWRLGIESTAVSLLSAVLLVPLLDEPRRRLLTYPIEVVFVLMLIAAPLVETLLLQALPIFIVRLLRGSLRTQILVSALIFALLHLPEGLGTGISAGVVGGLYFAFAYAHWRTKSRWQAFWVTAGSHAIHNGIAFVLLVLLGVWT